MRQRLRLAVATVGVGVGQVNGDQREVEIAGLEGRLVGRAIEDAHLGRCDEVRRDDFLHVVAVVDENESLGVAGHVAQTARPPGDSQLVDEAIDLLALLLDFLDRDQVEIV